MAKWIANVCLNGWVLLQRFIDEVDPQAFLMVTKSSEVIGKGFMSYI